MSSGHTLEITSEIYSETDFNSAKTENGTTISQFSFVYPSEEIDNEKDRSPVLDSDGDLIVRRKRRATIAIEHKKSTDLTLVGLQVWRGALVLADFLFHNRKKIATKRLLELGSGVGLTSIAAGIYAESDVTCSDINLGGILDIIAANVRLNEHLLNDRSNVRVMELDFFKLEWSSELKAAVRQANVILAADVIYDNDITDEFVKTLRQLLDPSDFNKTKDKEVYIALEKRYVFTLADLDVAAPCYEYFLQCIADVQKTMKWKLEFVDIDFPQYFDYERSKHLIIMKLHL